MARPTALKGWWLALLTKRAKGNMALLASLLNTTTKTVGRWATGEIRLPGLEYRRALRALAGESLLNRPDVPKYLRKKPRVETSND